MRNVLFALFALLAAAMTAAGSQPKIVGSQGALPIWFEPNVGQADAAVRFVGRGGGITLLIEGDGATLAGRGAPVVMKLVGARQPARTSAADPLPGKTNYLIGNDPSKWYTNIPQYSRVELEDVYSGIDLVYRGAAEVEYDFVVKAGGDPRAIRMHFDGVDALAINESGDLVLRARGTEILQRVPAVYQEFRGARQLIRGGYVLRSKTDVAFTIEAYDPSRTLVIDPELVSSSRYFGADDWTEGAVLDSAGKLFLCGMVFAAGTPKIGPGGGIDGFVAKLNVSGQQLLYMTYIGGSDEEYLNSIAVDAYGNAYVCGTSRSTDFPVVGDGQATNAGVVDAVVFELNPAGSSLLYSSYIGGSAYDEATAIVVNSSREVFLTGSTMSTDFPSYDSCMGGVDDGWVAKLDWWGRITWINCIGGTGRDDVNAAALDPSGQLFVAGNTTSPDFPVSSNAMQKKNAGLSDAFVAAINSNGSIGFATYWGGSGDDGATALAVDGGNRLYLTGYTNSPNFPAHGLSATPAGKSDAFVLKLMLPNMVMYSGTFGGTENEAVMSIAADAAGCVYTGGATNSGATFPTKASLFAPAGGFDVFVTKLDAHGEMMYSTLIGGSGEDRWTHVLPSSSTGITYVIGYTQSTDFPLVPPPSGTPPAGSTFIARIYEGAAYSATSQVVATASASSVHVTWAAVPDAASYMVDRHSVPTEVVGLQYDDPTVVPGNAYLYRVMPVDALHVQGYYSDDDLATVFVATDDPVVARSTSIKAVQVQELRTAIDKARAVVSLAPFAYSNVVSAGGVIRAMDFAEMQTAANEARTAVPLSRFSFTSLLTPDKTIRAVHVSELRQSIR